MFVCFSVRDVDGVSVTSTEAVAGSTARLICDVTPPIPGDKIHLVIWYKQSSDLPLCLCVSVSVTSTEAVAGSTARLICDVTPPIPGDKIHLVIWYKQSSDLSLCLCVSVSVTSTEAVAGSTARLICDVTPPIPGDKIHLVIWYKEPDDAPIYTVDARGRSVEQAVHWADNATLGPRATFRLAEAPARLTLDDVRDQDGGVYRCRIDFKKSPTRNTKVNLTVILPPQRLVVVDERGGGDNLHHYILGPYNEGTAVDISCTSVGGRPLPRVTWWQENALIDDTFEAIADRRVRNVLHIEHVERRHLHTAYTCQASNNHYAAPISTAVTLDVNLRPLWVRLLGDNVPLSADQSHELRCEVVGARPPPLVSWWKGSIPLRHTKENTSSDGNRTVSTLQFVPTIEDSGKILSCRANTPLISDTSVEDGWQLDIYHVPIVSLEMGSSINASSIQEGMDVYFECNIKSNPWASQISWLHNGQEIMSNSKGGVLVSNQSLVLQDVTRQRAGRYTCLAVNSEGEGESNTVYLDVKYRPVCRHPDATVGVGRRETAKVVCDMDANPADLQFFWWVNSTSGSGLVELPHSNWTTDRSRSTALYTPRSGADYGTLLCHSRNHLGPQQEPCVFHIIPAGRPDSVGNCSMVNQTDDSVQIECDAGFDGGISQTFQVEVYDSASQTLVTNLSRETPSFALQGLAPGQLLDLLLYAHNSKGRSDVSMLSVATLKPDRRIDSFPLQLSRSPVLSQLTPLAGVLAGVVLSLVLIALAVLLALRLYLKSRSPLLSQFTPLAGVLAGVVLSLVLIALAVLLALRLYLKSRSPLLSQLTPLAGVLAGVVLSLVLIALAVLLALRLYLKSRSPLLSQLTPLAGVLAGVVLSLVLIALAVLLALRLYLKSRSPVLSQLTPLAGVLAGVVLSLVLIALAVLLALRLYLKSRSPVLSQLTPLAGVLAGVVLSLVLIALAVLLALRLYLKSRSPVLSQLTPLAGVLAGVVLSLVLIALAVLLALRLYLKSRSPVLSQLTPLAGVLAGVVLSLVLIALAVLLALRLYLKSRSPVLSQLTPLAGVLAGVVLSLVLIALPVLRALSLYLKSRSPVLSQLTPLAGVLAEVMLSLVLIALAMLLALRLYLKSRSPVLSQLTPLAGVLAGVVLSLVLIALAVLLALRLRSRQPSTLKTAPDCDKPPCSSVDSVDKNPDIIPLNNDLEVCLDKKPLDGGGFDILETQELKRMEVTYAELSLALPVGGGVYSKLLTTQQPSADLPLQTRVSSFTKESSEESTLVEGPVVTTRF
ncbi:hemicentin-2-like [Macrosteles quadrilineatus]|uniref:hemicentin-2-like n=1 Tax=Macrosteles quadrilineatus TaxID=74068 RepID=UPI0023E33EC9|nr:hemicentin-2-like [Macrosteles quadrilineatus]